MRDLTVYIFCHRVFTENPVACCHQPIRESQGTLKNEYYQHLLIPQLTLSATRL